MRRDRFRFTGDLIPKNNAISLNTMPNVEGDWISTTTIECSVVHVDLEIPDGDGEVDHRVREYSMVRYAQFIANRWLSAISFAQGACYSAHIFRLENSAGYGRDVGPKLMFGHDGEDLSVDNCFELFAEMSRESHHFGMAADDYRKALGWGPGALFYCYRALETLRLHFDGGWEEMHKSLGTNQCAIVTLIKRHADKIRHGKVPDYEGIDSCAYYGLNYVSETLLAFLIKNGAAESNLEMPVLNHGAIPDFIRVQHVKDCPQNRT